ncbi:hypothetical protein [Flammeovirga sp. SubArs3]|uniref:hypothetical protein n=1 Tax=Flammeovirga sp. SubArs3 TaxID=2995316 RepID=UPI00248C7F20|nr:hypothetical protein [Flammeovirga sp. SubArs3]
MNKLLSRGILCLLLMGSLACQKQIKETAVSPEQEEVSSKRMPFSQRTFLCDNKNGMASIFEVEYDFQGLQGNATLQPIVSISGHSHIAITPDKKWVVVVGNGNGKITLVPIREDYSTALTSTDLVVYNLNRNVRITQVDFDRDDRLFIAGREFLEVELPSGVAWGTSTSSLLTLKKYRSFSNTPANGVMNPIETVSEEEEYYDDDALSSTRPKFIGGDILFSQNSEETDGFETERLISFTRHKDRVNGQKLAKAMVVEMGTYENNSGKEKFYVSTKRLFSLQGQNKVTGAALVGDNHFMVSSNGATWFKVYNFNGDVIANPTINFPFGMSKLANGDMASTQDFDKNTFNPKSDNNKEITDPGKDYYTEWNENTGDNNHKYAEVKLYRPASGMSRDPQNMTEEEYNDSRDSRPNAANADIADYRKNAAKFVSLGGNGGYVLMRFENGVAVNSTTHLQVVETTWGRPAEFTTIEDAYASYKEKASVYVLPDVDQRYYTENLENHADWTMVGTASITNNKFDISGVASDKVYWVKIVDHADTQTPDGFDVNFVAAYDAEPEILIPSSISGDLPCDITVDSYAIRSGDDDPCDKVRNGEAMYRIPNASEVVLGSVNMFDATQRAFFGRKSGRSAIIGVFVANIDGKLHAYEIHDDCSVKGMRHFEWGGENKNASFVPLPMKADKYDMSQVSNTFIEWDEYDIIYEMDGQRVRVPFTKKQENRIRYSNARID